MLIASLPVPPAPLKLRHYGALQIYYYYYYYYYYYVCIQASNKQPIKAAEKLIDIMIGQPFEVYEVFLDVLKKSNRNDILDIVNSTFQGQLVDNFYLTK